MSSGASFQIALEDFIGALLSCGYRVADGLGENRVRLPLVTSMHLGDRWEYLFTLAGLRMRAFGREPLAAGDQWLEISPGDLWVFQAPRPSA